MPALGFPRRHCPVSADQAPIVLCACTEPLGAAGWPGASEKLPLALRVAARREAFRARPVQTPGLEGRTATINDAGEEAAIDVEVERGCRWLPRIPKL